MRALMRKELRSLRPFVLVVLVVLLADVIDALLMADGARGFALRLAALSDELAVVQILLGFAVGSSLLVREIDDGTLQFLDALPLDRRAIFTAKIGAATLVLLMVPVGQLLLQTALHLATRSSLDGAAHPALLLTMLGLCMLLAAVALSAGLLLGFLRNVAWLLLALCAIGVKLLEETMPALAAALNPVNLLTLRFTGNTWQLPMATIWTQLGLLLLCGGGAYAMFVRAGRVRVRQHGFATSRRWWVSAGVAVLAAAVLGGVAMLVERSRSDRDNGADNPHVGVDFTPIASAQASTRHYSFSYPALSSARAGAVIAGADRTFDAVAALLRAPAGAPIDVDLSGTTRNHLGTAYFDRIRMQVGGEQALATLAHETTHVLARRLAGGEQAEVLDNMMVFNEGLAEWVEQSVTAHAGVSARDERAAAIVSARRLVTPRLLTDQDAFASAVDGNLKYPLGAILVDCLVRRYGPAAPSTLLLALASKDFPRDLKGYTLWQTAFQLSHFDLDLVLDDHARRLKQLEATYAAQIARLPRPRGSLVEQAGNADSGYAVGLRFDLALPPGATALVRLRPGTSGDLARYRISLAPALAAGTYLAPVPDQMITAGQICFQPGVMVEQLTIYEPWTCLPLASAGGP